MENAITTYKTGGLYVSYASESGAYFFGGCFEEAVNGLQEELRARAVSSTPTGEGRKKDAQH